MKTIHIKRIDPISVSTTVLILYTLGALIINGVNLLLHLIRGTPATQTIQSIPIFILMIVSTSLVTLIVCLVYNFISMVTGGIKIDVEESTRSSSDATKPLVETL